MKKIMLLSLLVLGCAKSSDSTPAAAATDFSGTWTFTSVQCYDSTLTTLNSTAIPTNGFTETVVIANNQYTATNVLGGCTVQFAGDIVVSGTTLSLSNRRVVSATGGSCTITMALTGGSITPTSSSIVYSDGQSQTSVAGAPYVYNATAKVFGLPSTYSNGISGNLCFVAYQKQ